MKSMKYTNYINPVMIYSSFKNVTHAKNRSILKRQRRVAIKELASDTQSDALWRKLEGFKGPCGSFVALAPRMSLFGLKATASICLFRSF